MYDKLTQLKQEVQLLLLIPQVECMLREHICGWEMG